MEILQTRVPKYQGGITANEQAGNYSSIKFSAFAYAWLKYKGWSFEKRRRNAIHIRTKFQHFFKKSYNRSEEIKPIHNYT